MQLRRHDVLDGAIAILDEYGLADLTMRRLASSLGVQPGALYWHFPNKQRLLAAVTDAMLAGVGPADTDGPVTDADGFAADARTAGEAGAAAETAGERNARPDTVPGTGSAWDAGLRDLAGRVRDGLLAHRDGAEVAAASYSARLASDAPRAALAAACRSGGAAHDDARMAADAVFFYVLGHTMDEQSRIQFDSHGALEADASPMFEAPCAADRFDFGLGLLIDGLRARLAAQDAGARTTPAGSPRPLVAGEPRC